MNKQWTPDQMRLIGELYLQAVNQPPSRRQAFLEEVCPEDEIVRGKVWKMLEGLEDDSHFLSRPAIVEAAEMFSQGRASLLGQQISHYRVERLIGTGGMGEVYLAEDVRLKRNVALKFLSTGLSFDQDRKRFIREARAAAAINHANVVTIHDVGEINGDTFLVMEYLEGQTLAERIKAGSLGLAAIMEIAIQVARALQALHERGVTHRDIKPANLMLSPRGEVKVMDLGVARINADTDVSGATGTVLGTPRYMSPEQLSRRPVDHRTDIFSLGVVLHEMAHGRLPRPFVTSSAQTTPLDRIIFKCLEEDPSKRYQSAGDLLLDLQSRQRELVRRKPIANWYWITACTAVTLALSVLLFVLPRPQPESVEPGGRLLVRATSERSVADHIPISHRPYYLAVSNDGEKVFALEGRVLSIVRVKDRSVRTVLLPQEAWPLAVSRNGQLYIGSTVDGLMVLDVATERLLDKVIPTRGRVFDIAFSPDGQKAFLAQSEGGLRRLSLSTGELVLISDRKCPESLEMNRQGTRLYVAYQCSGPSGSPGHDVVEIFDVASEARLQVVGGRDIPMVGGDPAVSPDGNLVVFDGVDACAFPSYDHVGCKSVPSRIYHLYDSFRERIVQSFEFPPADARGTPVFWDNSRFLLPGKVLSVIDASDLKVLETLDLGPSHSVRLVFSPDKRRAYLGTFGNNGIRVLEAEPAGCSPAKDGLRMFFPFEGTLADFSAATDLMTHGSVEFKPGRVGQALFLDGRSFVSAPRTGHFQLGTTDFSITLYVKLAAVEKETVLLDWTDRNPERGVRFTKTSDDRVTVDAWSGGPPLKSTSRASAGTWYHLAVTRNDRQLALYVNGELESLGTPPSRVYEWLGSPLFFGAQGNEPSLNGWLDEVAFYNRALNAEEVRELYQSRETGACAI